MRGTELSRLCSRIIAEFLELGCELAEVKAERMGRGAREVYVCLVGQCSTNRFRESGVRARMSDGRVFLERPFCRVGRSGHLPTP